MSSFRDQSWSARFAQMGDLAEGKFEEWFDRTDARRRSREARHIRSLRPYAPRRKNR